MISSLTSFPKHLPMAKACNGASSLALQYSPLSSLIHLTMTAIDEFCFNHAGCWLCRKQRRQPIHAGPKIALVRATTWCGVFALLACHRLWLNWTQILLWCCKHLTPIWKPLQQKHRRIRSPSSSFTLCGSHMWQVQMCSIKINSIVHTDWATTAMLQKC